jgi:hypothetical protein
MPFPPGIARRRRRETVDEQVEDCHAHAHAVGHLLRIAPAGKAEDVGGELDAAVVRAGV